MITFAELVAKILSWISLEQTKAELKGEKAEGSTSIYIAGRKDALKEMEDKVKSLLDED